MSRPAPPTPSPTTRTPARIDRLIVHLSEDAAAGARLADRLPNALEPVARAGALDESRVRGLVAQAVREAAR